ncbi:MAG: prepilin-type N-terminal cleavage/methylation domain-containing protein [Candidatus Adiutrix sp.]|jgi:prepilin-type N-terminal cleavage/methylation domain-containing protein|nr:prepilin-type N-terminal cleavage/methylation domain-containing protein [Candidatus Adiutrix sp.]
MRKKGFTLIEVMIVVVIIAILAMVAVAMYQRYLERARNSAAQNIVWQVALAEATNLIEAHAYVLVAAKTDVAPVGKLMASGFRPDPNVGFVVLPPKAGGGGFVAFAAHRAPGSLAHVCDLTGSAGVKPFDAGTSWGADLPAELPLFVLTGVAANPVASTETVKVDITTGRVTSSGP